MGLQLQDTLNVTAAEAESTAAAVRKDVEDALDSTREAAEEAASDLADVAEEVTGKLAPDTWLPAPTSIRPCVVPLRLR